ncbi:hypothetical protein HMPREF0322_00135 [Desulfitobacterium hafniense DP7]|uniref:Uncharacterized protein n=1 Tax=Desulfitobacterium hafniense DP7 TaxID=537010 RepID=G9XGR9_DESHA|nr:hypothetical protein HMPREF0322_00135 [Desulfitobacterium hafniense DP7]
MSDLLFGLLQRLWYLCKCPETEIRSLTIPAGSVKGLIFVLALFETL